MHVIFNHTSALCLQKATIIKTLFSCNQHHLFRNLVNQTVLDYSYNTSLSMENEGRPAKMWGLFSLHLEVPIFLQLKGNEKGGGKWSMKSGKYQPIQNILGTVKSDWSLTMKLFVFLGARGVGTSCHWIFAVKELTDPSKQELIAVSPNGLGVCYQDNEN